MLVKQHLWKPFIFNLFFFLFFLFFQAAHAGSFRSRGIQSYRGGLVVGVFFFSIIYLASVFFQTPRYFQFFKNEKKLMLSASINQQPGRVTSYQGFKSASWFSDLLSLLIISDVSHMHGPWCQVWKHSWGRQKQEGRREGKEKERKEKAGRQAASLKDPVIAP